MSEEGLKLKGHYILIAHNRRFLSFGLYWEELSSYTQTVFYIYLNNILFL